MASKTARFRRLEVNRLDNYFRRLKAADVVIQSAPAGGWVRAIRVALGMSVVQLAKRLGVSRAAAYALESREAKGNITLAQLYKAAAALECEVVYTLVPRESLERMIRDQARARAEAEMRAANASMGLEAEGVGGDAFLEVVTSASSYTEGLTNLNLWDD